MRNQKRYLRLAFPLIGLVIANCAFVQGLVQPPTPTAKPTFTPTITDTSTPTLTTTPTEPVFPTAEELVGTRWTLVYDSPQDEHREFDIEFQEDRRLKVFFSNDNTPDNDTWKLVGTQITLSMNNGYAVYTGEFVDADTMAGEAENVVGESWDWVLYRKPG